MPPKRGRPSNAQREAERSAAVSKGKAAASTSAAAAAQESANTPNGSITVSVGGLAASADPRSPETAKTASMAAPRTSASASKKSKGQTHPETAANTTAQEPDGSSTSNAMDVTTNGTTTSKTTITNTHDSKPTGNGTPKKNAETAMVVAGNGDSEMDGRKSKNNDTALARGNAYTAASRVIGTGYENINNLEEIQLRQFQEDIDAYQHDLAYCTATLDLPDLTPQETRTFQLRQLDLGHQIRHCQHRIENLQVQLRRQGIPFTNYGASSGGRAYTASLLAGSGQVAGMKRVRGPSDDDEDDNGGKTTGGSAKKAKLTPDEPQLLDADGDEMMATGSREADGGGSPNGNNSSGNSPHRLPYGTPGTWEFNIPVHPSYPHQHHQNGNAANSPQPYVDEENQQNTALQRLGYWKCRLCSAPKYLLAGTGRSPAAPCKWPLKDISKMITHFTEMHTEHSPAERCSELGYALAKNRGPFEYWLRRTRAQNVGDGEIIDEVIETLINGVMPLTLRRLSRAAAGMPA
ncbi:hypothetical protein SMACR_09167 [Sordaria macrospora]|uniref:WGS project CABT00000000 data, contig 2.74 n=2 Tax=Sordaria macrospora TaxID=5147 RepID=F7WBE5_SORMK|nr:uncharacterized protein SMAC_09167 [Sordaria macrospora k-hell]KAA8634000.1 hypothetical protein SMACR_09167 [Sordaria macrospora]WPJ66164.1 hypothetical protein SMAC4_09167 [Sordaria macrospora]CCC14956.1 unnamed protein product [Sordaria macrospora k-hell]